MRKRTDKALISIIVPVYDVEDYLRRCVDSLVGQTYSNLEILLIDDGSQDNSGVICDEYASNDPRIKVIHKKNGGLSDARNAGLDVAKGDFILCVDSDDYIHETTVQTLYTSAVLKNADIATCGFVVFSNQPTIDDLSDQTRYSRALSGIEATEKMLYQHGLTNSAWGKLYRRSLFIGIRYPKGKICEDLGTTYRLLLKSRRVALNPQTLYYYYRRSGSIINSEFSEARMVGLTFAEEQLRYIKLNYSSLVPSAINRLFMEAIFTGSIINDPRYRQNKTKCMETIKQTRRIVVRDNKSKLSYRLLALFSIVHPGLAIYFYKFISPRLGISR